MDYDEDPRILCKYGHDCYQKNPEHHRKYKHPKRSVEEPEHSDSKRHKGDFGEPTEESISNAESVGKDVEDISETPESNGSTKEANYVEIPDDISSRIETVFLVKMPDDFFSLYELCKTLNKNNPHDALSDADLKLVGPYDLIDRDLKRFTADEGLCHYRYFYDPPEFQTILVSNNKKDLHYGYFRDDPKCLPVFVGSNNATNGCTIEIVGSNIFSACQKHIEKVKKMSDPFRKMKLQKIQNALADWCKKHNYLLDSYAKTSRERRNKMITKTFHGAGIVVPFDKKTEVGYRELKENDENLKKILHLINEAKSEEGKEAVWSKLETVITFANIANDESDFGTSLELGIDLFCFGSSVFHKTILNILPTSYELLGRDEFTSILKAHLKRRIKGNDVNTIV